MNYLRVDILGNEVVSQYLINAQRLIDQNGALVSHLRPTPPRIPLEELLLIADSLVSSQLLDDNTYDDLLLAEEEISYVIQINGKKRGLIKTARDINEENLMKLVFKDENLKKYFDNKKFKRKIFVPGRLVNIII